MCEISLSKLPSLVKFFYLQILLSPNGSYFAQRLKSIPQSSEDGPFQGCFVAAGSLTLNVSKLPAQV